MLLQWRHVTRSAKVLVVDVVLVVRDCALALAKAIDRIPHREIRSIVVVDNGSTDNTSQVARDRGAVVLREPQGGYGQGCQRAIQHLEALPTRPDVVVFIDPLSSEDPAELGNLLLPFHKDRADLVIATLDHSSHRQLLSDKAMLALIGVIYGQRFAELSTFRALRFPALVALGLSAREAGWNVEMLVKGVRLGLSIVEVPVARLRNSEAKRKSSIATGQKLLRIIRHAAAR